MLKFTLRFLLLLSIALLVGCSSSSSIDTYSLEGLIGLSNPSSGGQNGPGGAGTGKIREMALRETALSLAAQSALACRSKYIDNELIKQSRNLDAIYDFNALILEHNILPPVLLEGRNTLNLADAQTIRISDRTYKVAKQARFITTPPNWRQYLWMDYKLPELPHPSLLPKTKAECKIWEEYIAKGWQKGSEQASIILEENLALIKEDFTGMILYRKLLAMNMVSPPYVSDTDLGVTGDGGEIHIDDRVLRITALPALNVNSNEWRAAVAKDEDVLEQFKSMENRIQTARINITNKSWQPTITPINRYKLRQY